MDNTPLLYSASATPWASKPFWIHAALHAVLIGLYVFRGDIWNAQPRSMRVDLPIEAGITILISIAILLELTASGIQRRQKLAKAAVAQGLPPSHVQSVLGARPWLSWSAMLIGALFSSIALLMFGAPIFAFGTLLASVMSSIIVLLSMQTAAMMSRLYFKHP